MLSHYNPSAEFHQQCEKTGWFVAVPRKKFLWSYPLNPAIFCFSVSFCSILRNCYANSVSIVFYLNNNVQFRTNLHEQLLKIAQNETEKQNIAGFERKTSKENFGGIANDNGIFSAELPTVTEFFPRNCHKPTYFFTLLMELSRGVNGARWSESEI